MRKIFIVIGSLDLGGTEKQLLLKLLSLNDKLNFTLIVFSKKGDFYKNFKQIGIRILDISNDNKFIPLKIIKILFSLILVFKKEKPSIVNFYLPHSYLICGWLSFFFLILNF